MCEDKTAVILSAGTELTEGITQDAHVRYLSSELTSLGFAVRRGVLLPDDAALFRVELARACHDACLVVLTGGLGPTTDDLTREIVAEAAGVPLDFHPEAWQALKDRFKGRTVSDTNRKQATAPRGFALLPNPHGTAPGFQGAVGAALVVALPGPPSELRPMFAASVLPLIQERWGGPGAEEILWGTALMVPESSLEEALRKSARHGVTWGTRVDEDRIAFSLRGGTRAERESLFADLMERVGPVRIRAGERKPAELLMDALMVKHATLVTAESCTGGLIGKYMTDIPGSSNAYWGGLVSYANDAKTRLLGVEERIVREHGAVSEETVRAMAQGALHASDADTALAVTGIAGPDGGTAEKPVGTVWIAVALRDQGCRTRLFNFSGTRDMVRRRSAVASMLFAESELLGREFLDTRTKW